MEGFRTYLSQNFGLSPEEQRLVSSYMQEENLRPNTFILEEGAVGKSIAFLLEGVVRYFTYDEAGNDPTCYFSFETHILFDPFSYRQQAVSTLNIKTACPCRLAILGFREEQELIEVFPRWKEIANQMLLEVSLEFANQKTMMAMRATERYAYFEQQYPQVLKRVPLQFVASYLGITQQSLSRLRRG